MNKNGNINLTGYNMKQAMSKNSSIYMNGTFPRPPKPQGTGIVRALGQQETTGGFKRIEASQGKAAAIGALQNKLAKKRGQPIPYHQ